MFSTPLIDDMHRALACAKLRLSPTADKATELVATEIVELAKAGRKGDELTAQTVQFFEGYQSARGADTRPR